VKQRDGAREGAGRTVSIAVPAGPVAANQWPVDAVRLIAPEFQARRIEHEPPVALAALALLEEDASAAGGTVKLLHGPSGLIVRENKFDTKLVPRNRGGMPARLFLLGLPRDSGPFQVL
jgi:hypothetical protein